jgi:hypothetical protein
MEFNLVIKNPGGLEASAKVVIEIDEIKRTTLINAGIAWHPLIRFYGEPSGDTFYPLGVKAHANVLFRTPLNFYAGPELEVSWLDPDMLYAGVNLVVMKWLYDYKLGFGYRLGAAYFILPEHFRQISVNMGISVHWRMVDMFLLEAGIDFAHLFENRPLGHLRPFVGLGLIF